MSISESQELFADGFSFGLQSRGSIDTPFEESPGWLLKGNFCWGCLLSRDCTYRWQFNSRQDELLILKRGILDFDELWIIYCRAYFIAD